MRPDRLTDKRRDGVPILSSVSPRDYHDRFTWQDGHRIEKRSSRQDHPRFNRWQIGQYLQAVGE